MFTTIILTAGAIGVMAASGIGVSAVFNWLNTEEFKIGKKGSKSPGREFGSPLGGPHSERMNSLKGKASRPMDF